MEPLAPVTETRFRVAGGRRRPERRLHVLALSPRPAVAPAAAATIWGCPACGAYFSSWLVLLAHGKRRHGVAKLFFFCVACADAAALPSPAALQAHIRSAHAAERALVWETCFAPGLTYAEWMAHEACSVGGARES